MTHIIAILSFLTLTLNLCITRITLAGGGDFRARATVSDADTFPFALVANGFHIKQMVNAFDPAVREV